MRFRYLDMVKVINKDSFYFDPKGIINTGCVLDWRIKDGKTEWDVAMFNGVVGKFQHRAWFSDKELKLDKIEPPKKEDKKEEAKK